MMQCQICGDQNGPWIYSEGGPIPTGKGIICEDCYAYEEVINKMVTLIKNHKSTKGKSELDIVAFVEGIENRVYDELGLK